MDTLQSLFPTAEELLALELKLSLRCCLDLRESIAKGRNVLARSDNAKPHQVDHWRAGRPQRQRLRHW
jgi:hypothetical protein